MTINKEARENKVLEAIVKAHIDSAYPVGSKHIAQILGLSSATIRSVMFELEKAGFIMQPYTSAGRVPTDLGYRRYVDCIMFANELSESDDALFLRLRQLVNRKKLLEEVIEEISSAISRITKYTGIALAPNNKLYFDGTYHMLEQPEFSEQGTAREFLRAIEEKEELMRIMNEDLEEAGTIIRIGRENTFSGLRGCTIITSTYKIKNRASGNIGIIGPMRMRYEEVVPAIEYLAGMTTEILEEIS